MMDPMEKRAINLERKIKKLEEQISRHKSDLIKNSSLIINAELKRNQLTHQLSPLLRYLGRPVIAESYADSDAVHAAFAERHLTRLRKSPP